MARSQVLMLDDGELDDVQAILQEIGVGYGRVRGGAIVPNTPPPTRLFIATPRRVGAVKLPEPGTPEAEGLIRIVVVNEDSPTLRSRLRAVGFDYLVRRPVHPEALRLLLLRCVYTGQERRTEPRVPVGLEVSFRAGLLPRRATLVDLSTRGCRLLSKWALEPGKRISLSIPVPGSGQDTVHLKGRVLRMRLDERLGADGPYSAAVSFESVAAEAREGLDRVLRERERGPATLGGEPAAQPPELDAPETRAEGLARGLDVPVDVTLDAAPEAAAEPRRPEARPQPAAPSAATRPDPSAPPRPAPAQFASPAVPAVAKLSPPAMPKLSPPAVPKVAPPTVPKVAPPTVPKVAPPAMPKVAPPAVAKTSAPAQPAPPAQRSRPAAAPPEPWTEPDEPPSTAFPGDRRHGRRGAYPRRVPAFGDRAMRVLVARDLSLGGMRVEPDSGVRLGDRLHLAIYGSPDEEPFLVWATVARNEGDEGMVLSFDQVHPVVAQQLEKVVAGLPAVESLHDDEARAMGTVVSEILEQ
jgi:hypothetical protein